MNPSDRTLSPAEAQLLMSQLLDGELAPADAAALEAYLERRPEAVDWLESNDLSRQAAFGSLESDGDANATVSAILERIASAKPARARLLSFPAAFGSLAAAAAIAAAILIGFDRSWDSNAAPGFGHFSAVVESVDTNIPDASPVVYTDQESGWTVVWVAQLEPVDQG